LDVVFGSIAGYACDGLLPDPALVIHLYCGVPGFFVALPNCCGGVPGWFFSVLLRTFPHGQLLILHGLYECDSWLPCSLFRRWSFPSIPDLALVVEPRLVLLFTFVTHITLWFLALLFVVVRHTRY
jgi:hypothetical protein